MQIDLTVSEACYVRALVAERRQALNRRLGKIRRYQDSRGDRVSFQEQLALIQGELVDLNHVDRELLRIISHSLIAARLKNEFDIIPK